MTASELRLLVVNANTSETVTRIVADAARSAASDGTVIIPVTAAFGVPVIQTPADHEVAFRACVDAVTRNAGRYDAVLVAVSLDTAVEELQRICPVPVVGMTGAALQLGAETGAKVGVLTIGETMKVLFLERFGPDCAAAVHAINLGPAAALGGRDHAARLLAEGVAELAGRGIELAIPMGATVAGLAALIQPQVTIPVVDSMACGVQLAERLVREARAGAAS